jgi:2-aminomuconate deaminase
LARTFSAQAHADNKLKAIWWLSAVMGQHNRYKGKVHAYGPIFGTGSAVATLKPTDTQAIGHEFDEDDVEVFAGDRDVLGTNVASTSMKTEPPQEDQEMVTNGLGQQPVFPSSRRVGDLIYLSGVGPRNPITQLIPGGPIKDNGGLPLDYDTEAQTRAVIENIRQILEASGSRLENIIDVTAFLVDMDRDFNAYNKVYTEYFNDIQAARTTLAIQALPSPIAVEFKVVALADDALNNVD